MIQGILLHSGLLEDLGDGSQPRGPLPAGSGVRMEHGDWALSWLEAFLGGARSRFRVPEACWRQALGWTKGGI